MKRLLSILSAPLTVAALVAPASAVTMDGTLDGGYISLHTQTTQTQFGNATTTTTSNANGSELDAIHYLVDGSDLYIFIAGNMESNFNKLDIFIDSKTGGQNQLRADNPNVDFDQLNRMGPGDGNPGLKFDAGFESDYFLDIRVGDPGGGVALFASFAETNTGGGGTGNDLGQATPGGDGTLSGGTNPYGIAATIDNSNTGGVDGGCGASSGAGVSTGVELKIPLSAIGSPSGTIKICAFVNGSGHDFVSNQVLGSLPTGTCNLGEPRLVDFSSITGDQFVTTGTVPVELSRFEVD